jgi:hypothetical protein
MFNWWSLFPGFGVDFDPAFQSTSHLAKMTPHYRAYEMQMSLNMARDILQYNPPDCLWLLLCYMFVAYMNDLNNKRCLELKHESN